MTHKPRAAAAALADGASENGRRRWKPTVIVIDSSDEEVEAQEREEKKAAKPRASQPGKRKWQGAQPSGRGQLTLQLSQPSSSQPSQQDPPGAAEAGAVRPRPQASGLAGVDLGGSELLKGQDGEDGVAPATVRPAELWVTKYAPQSEAELVLHKKKVQEVQQWLEWQRRSLGQPGVSRVAVITGPPGCGKSTVLRVLAAEMGFELCEWQPPTPTLWNEYQYQAGSGVRYLSKLDAFEEFSLRAKLPALALTKKGPAAATTTELASQPQHVLTGAQQQQPPQQHLPHQRHVVAAQRPKLLIVDDLPHTAGPEQRERLAAALGDLARTSRYPLVVMATEPTGRAQQDRGAHGSSGSGTAGVHGLHKDITAALEAAQAVTFSFNPITALIVTKALKSILEREGLTVAEDQVHAIAEQCQGDLHNAISTLQFVTTGVKPSTPAAQAARKGRGVKRRAAPAPVAAGAGSSQQQGEEKAVGYASRDSTLSMFHALGKLLYNKRAGQLQAAGGPSDGGQERGSKRKGTTKAAGSSFAEPGPSAAAAAAAQGLPLAGWAQRPSMEFDPEAVLAQSGLDAGSVGAYLHENMPNFVDDGAVEDLAGCLDYLSQADCIAGGFRYGGGGVMLVDDEPGVSSSLADAAAASTAARGVCFSNAHPAPRRFLPLSAPALFLVERAVRSNKEQLQREVARAWVLAEGCGRLEGSRMLASELLPYVRSIQAYSRDPRLLSLQPPRWLRLWQGQLYDSTAGSAGQGAGGLAGGSDSPGSMAQGEGVQSEDAIEDSGEDW